MQKGEALSVRFLADYWYGIDEVSTYIPEGTCLFGLYDEENPTENGAECTFTLGDTTWNVVLAHIKLSALAFTNELQEMQRSVAQEHLLQAEQQEKQGELEQAQRSFARAVVEFGASGLPAAVIAQHRVRRAMILTDLECVEDACVELEVAASVYERAMQDKMNTLFHVHLDYAEQAANTLMLLGILYTFKAEDSKLACACIVRLLTINKVIKKRYEIKVDILLSVADMLHFLEDEEEAYTYFDQAYRFYSQQLAARDWDPKVIGLKKRIERLKNQFAQTKRTQTIKCTIEATTSDELEMILQHLQTSKVPGLEVTKGVHSFSRSRDPRAAQSYRAHHRITIQPQQNREGKSL